MWTAPRRSYDSCEARYDVNMDKELLEQAKTHEECAARYRKAADEHEARAKELRAKAAEQEGGVSFAGTPFPVRSGDVYYANYAPRTRTEEDCQRMIEALQQMYVGPDPEPETEMEIVLDGGKRVEWKRWPVAPMPYDYCLLRGGIVRPKR